MTDLAPNPVVMGIQTPPAKLVVHMEPILGHEDQQDGGPAQVFFDRRNEVVTRGHVTNVQEHARGSETVYQTLRKGIRGPAGVRAPIVDEDHAIGVSDHCSP